MPKIVFILIILLALPLTPAVAQPLDSINHNWWSPDLPSELASKDSLGLLHPLNSIELFFDHTLSLYDWRGSANIGLTSSHNLLNETVALLTIDTRSKLRQDTKTRTSEGTVLLGISQPVFNKKLAAGISLFGNSYSLSNSISASIYEIGTLQNLSNGYGIGSLQYQLSEDLLLSGSAGIAYKSFLYGKSSGSVVQANGILSSIEVGDNFYLDATGTIDERHFTDIDETMRNDGIRFHLTANFSESGSNDLSSSIGFKRRDFYFTTDSINSIAQQQRNEFTIELHDVLRYPLVQNSLTAVVSTDFYPKTIDRTTNGINFSTASSGFLTSSTFLLPSRTDAFDLSISTRLEWVPNISINRPNYYSAELRYSENSESNEINLSDLSISAQGIKDRLKGIFEATSFDGQQSILSLLGIMPIGLKDSLQINFSSRLFKYDTPSPDNHDDRDELYLNTAIQFRHEFDPLLSLNAQIRLSQNHLVYLASDRSAQNVSGKTIAFSLSTTYFPSTFRNTLSAEVFANYSVYDFDIPQFEQLGGRDYLIRGVNVSDSLTIVLDGASLKSATTMFESNATLRYYERGAYNAERFSERPLLATAEISAEALLDLFVLKSQAPSSFKIGLRGFFQLRTSPTTIGSTSLHNEEQVDRIGPVASIILDRGSNNGLRLHATAWYSIINHTIFSTKEIITSNSIEGAIGIRWTF